MKPIKPKRPKKASSQKSQNRLTLELHPEPPKKILQEIPTINPHDIDLFDKVNPLARGEASPGKIKFYCTGSIDLMLNGIDVELDMNMNPDQCKAYLLEQINSKNLLNKYDERIKLDIFLPGGIPFSRGELSDLFNNLVFKPKPVIYGILYRFDTTMNTDEQLDDVCFELCNASNAEKRGLISPLCDSSDRGLADMACLLGYINNGGIHSDKLIKACAAFTHFPPLITSLSRIFEQTDINGHDIIAVTSSLFTFIRDYIPFTVEDRYILEFTLRFCTYITCSRKIPDELPLLPINISSNEKNSASIKTESNEEKKSVWNTDFLNNFNQLKTIYLWQEDIKDFSFNYLEFDENHRPEPIAIEYIHNVQSTFKPILPLSIQFVINYQIVQGTDYNYLFLTPTPTKDSKCQNFVEIANPMTGMIESVDIDSFASSNSKNNIDTTQLVDPINVKEIIDVCLDESGSMKLDINKKTVNPKKLPEKFSRVDIAQQYLTLFANRAYGFRISCILGLISFNDQVTPRCPLSPLVPDFETKGLNGLHPNKSTRLWDAIMASCDRLVKFSLDKNGKPLFKNARKRILVVSDGDDHTSDVTIVDVAKRLKENGIVLDSVIIEKSDDCKKLATLSHITGGLSFKASDNIEQDLKIFQQISFLSLEKRAKSRIELIPGQRKTIATNIKPNDITAEFIEEANQHTQFDTEVTNDEDKINRSLTQLSTPRSVCYLSQKENRQIPNSSQRRIFRELHYAALINDPKSEFFDSDMKIFTNTTSINQWAVFLRGPSDSPYADKWWYLLVTFSELYPCQPPQFRFISIPYHLNVSSEGFICLNIIDKSYMATMHVKDILQDIKQIFITTFEATPVQIDVFNTYRTDRERYNQLARESALNNAKDNFEDYFNGRLVIKDEVSDDFSLNFTPENIPKYMISQITMKFLKKENMIRASSGVYYDRDELRQLLMSHKDPVCVITGKPLTEDPSEI